MRNQQPTTTYAEQRAARTLPDDNTPAAPYHRVTADYSAGIGQYLATVRGATHSALIARSLEQARLRAAEDADALADIADRFASDHA